MTAALYRLNRHRDISGVSGEGADVATICEFDSGLIAMHWNSETPSVTVYTDIRHIEKLHGHEGASTLEINDSDRLVRAYERAVFWLLRARHTDRPVTCEEHPDFPGRLRMTFENERAWRFWISLFEGSSHAATHVEQNGEMRHRWIDPAGDLYLEYFTPLADDNPLETFHREDQ